MDIIKAIVMWGALAAAYAGMGLAVILAIAAS